MSDTVKVGRKLNWAQNAVETITAHNKSGGTVAPGDVVILDTTNSTATEVAFTTTTSQDNKLVLGMVIENMANNGYGEVQTKGPTALLKVDGTTDISVEDHISTFTTVKIGASATAGKGGAFAIALEAYTSNDSSGVIDAWLTGGAARIDTASHATSFASPTFTGTVSVNGAAGFNATGIITCAGVASGTDTIIVELGDILVTDGLVDITAASDTVDIVTITRTASACASNEAALKIIDNGNIASGGNMLRLEPTGTPDAASILFEIVGASKIGQAMYIDGDPTGIDLVHIECGGNLTNGFACLGITNSGDLGDGGALLNLTMSGTPHTAARIFEIDSGSQDAIAMYIDCDAATQSAVQILGSGTVADGKAMLHITNTGTLANGSALVRIDSGATATATAYGLEIACGNTNTEALHVSAGTSLFAEAITLGTTAKLQFTDGSQYLYAPAANKIDIYASTWTKIVAGPFIVGVDATGYDVTFFGTGAGYKVWYDIDADTSGTWYFGANQKGVDVYFYGNTSGSTMVWDKSVDCLILNGSDLQLEDSDILSFGTGATKAGDWNITSDGTNLALAVVGAAATFNMGATSHLCNILMGSTSKIQFLDTGIYINSSANGKLVIASDGAGTDDITLSGTITTDDNIIIGSAKTIEGAGTGGNGIVLKNLKNATQSSLSGTQKDVEIDIGGSAYHFTVYPTKA